MGVKGLWELLAPGGKRVPLEKIDNMRLAIDLSVWLMRMATALRDKSGAAIENPHLVGVFTRCCKLAYYGARPVFVFDGKAPHLKDATLRKRRQLRQTKERELERIAKRIVTKELLHKAMVRASEKEAEGNAKKKPKSEGQEPPQIDYNQKIQPWNKEPNTFSSCFVSEIDTTNSSIDDSDSEAGFLCPGKSHLSQSQKERLKELKAAKEETRYRIERDAIVAQRSMNMSRSEDYIPTSNEVNSAQDFSKSQLSNFLLKTSINKEISNIENSHIQNNDRKKSIASDKNLQYVYIKDYNGSISGFNASNPQVNNKGNENEIVLDDNIGEGGFIVEPSIFNGDANKKKDEFEISLDEYKSEGSSIFDSSMFGVEKKDNLEGTLNENKNYSSSIFDSTMFGFESVDNKKDEEFENVLEGNKEEKKSVFDFDNDDNKKKEEIEITLDENEIEGSFIFDSSMFDVKEEDFNFTLNDNKNFSLSMLNFDADDKKKKAHENALNKKPILPTAIKKNKQNKSTQRKPEKQKSSNRDMPLLNDGDNSDSKENDKQKTSLFGSTLLDIDKEKENKNEKSESTTLNEKNGQNDLISIKFEELKTSLFGLFGPDAAEDKNEENNDFEVTLNGNEEFKSSIFDESLFDPKEDKEVELEITTNNIDKKHDIIPEIDKNPSVFESTLLDIDNESISSENKKPEMSTSSDKKDKESNPTSKEPEEPKISLFDINDVDDDTNIKENDEEIPSLFESELLNIDDDDNQLMFDDSTFDNDNITFDSGFLEAKDPKQKDDIFDEDFFLQDMDELAADIEKEKQKYDSRARGLLTVDGKTIAELNSQVQYLFDLFGVPYVCSPSEADAQCAYLNYAGLVDAVVSDDVDVFLFGAQTVYRFLFSMNSIMEEYTSEGIESKTGLTREDLQKLALFLGSDYTIGIYGVGRVHALEIITAFPDLVDFRRWCHGDTPLKEMPFALGKSVVNLKPFLKVPDSFPSRAVLNAYQTPMVEFIQEPFEWKRPKIDELRKFGVMYLGWTLDKIDKFLEPVIVRAAMMGSVPRNPTVNGIADIRNFFVVQDNGNKEKKEIGFANGSEITNRLGKRIREIYYMRTHK